MKTTYPPVSPASKAFVDSYRRTVSRTDEMALGCLVGAMTGKISSEMRQRSVVTARRLAELPDAELFNALKVAAQTSADEMMQLLLVANTAIDVVLEELEADRRAV
jgi:hypothetical protein